MVLEYYNDIIKARLGYKSEDHFFRRSSAVGGVTRSWYYASKGVDFPVNKTGSVYNNTHDTVGIIPLATCSPVTNIKKLLTFGIQVSSSNMAAVMLVDLLWATITYQDPPSGTFTMPDITRYTAGTGNQIMIVPYATNTIAACNVSFTYTDDQGVSRTTPDFTTIGSCAPNRSMISGEPLRPFVPLHASSKGVRKLTGITVSGSGLSDYVMILLVHPIGMFPTITANRFFDFDMTSGVNKELLETITSDGKTACLSLLSYHVGTTTATYQGFMKFTER